MGLLSPTIAKVFTFTAVNARERFQKPHNQLV